MKENKPTNETGKNPETEQEKEVLPSFFQTLKTSTSKPLPNREVLEYNIMHSAPVKTNTEGYRSMTKVDKRTAEDIKHRLPCITPSVQLKGSSKKLTDFRKETYWLMLDYDDVPPKNIAALRQKARKIPFTMVFYIKENKAVGESIWQRKSSFMRMYTARHFRRRFCPARRESTGST